MESDERWAQVSVTIQKRAVKHIIAEISKSVISQIATIILICSPKQVSVC